MATVTSTQVAANAGPRVVHAGSIPAFGIYNANGATISAGDVIQMVQVPNGAVIDEVIVGGLIPITALTFTVGDGGSSARFISTSTLSATAVIVRMNAGAGLGYQYSLSSDATTRYDTIDITIGTASSVTVTCSIALTVFYHMPPA